MTTTTLRALFAEARALAHAKQTAIDALRQVCQAEIDLGQRVATAANAAAANTYPDAFHRAQHTASIRQALAGQDSAFLHALRDAFDGHRVGSLLRIDVNAEPSVVDAAERGIRGVESRIKEIT